MGERPEEAGELAPLSSPSPARGFGGDAPLFRPGRGNRKGTRGKVGWAGARVAAQLGPGGGGLGRGSSGGEACSFFLLTVLFSVFSLFVYFLFCFISFKSI